MADKTALDLVITVTDDDIVKLNRRMLVTNKRLMAIDKQARKTASSLNSIGDGVNLDKLIGSTNKSTSSGKRHERQIRQTTAAMKEQGVVIDSNTRLFGQMQNQIMNFASIYAMERMLSTLIKVRGEFEIQNVALAAMLQNKELADRLFIQVQDLALKSPFKILEMNKALKQLKAYRIENEELIPTLSNLSDISAGLGVDMDRLILAYGQIRATDWLRGTELRQLTEAGINILEPLIEKFAELGETGLTTADVMKKIEARMVSFSMVKEIFRDMTREGGIFFEQQIKQAETLKGKVSILTDAFHKMLNEVGTDFDSSLKGSLDLLIDLTSNFQQLINVLVTTVSGIGVYKVAMFALFGGYKKWSGLLSVLISGFSNMSTHIKVANGQAESMVATNAKLTKSNQSLSTSAYMAGRSTKSYATNLKQADIAAKGAESSMKALRVSFGAIIAVVGIVTTIVSSYVESQRQLREESEKNRKALIQEIIQLEKSKIVVNDNNKSLEERNKQLKKTKELYPDIIGSLTDEEKSLVGINKQLDIQIEKRRDLAILEAGFGVKDIERQGRIRDNQAEIQRLDALGRNTILQIATIAGDANLNKLLGQILEINSRKGVNTNQAISSIKDLANNKKVWEGNEKAYKQYLKNIRQIDSEFITATTDQKPEEGFTARGVIKFENEYENTLKRIAADTNTFNNDMNKSFSLALKSIDAEYGGKGVFARVLDPDLVKKDFSLFESVVFESSDEVVGLFAKTFGGTRFEDPFRKILNKQFEDLWKATSEVFITEAKKAGIVEEDAKGFWKEIILDQFGFGVIGEVIEDETDGWKSIVNNLIKNSGLSDINGLVVNDTQDLKVYKETLKDVNKTYKEYINAFNTDSDAAKNDKNIKLTNEQYKDQVKLLEKIALYIGLNLTEDDKKGKSKYKSVTQDLDILLKSLEKLKKETGDIEKSLDFSLGLDGSLEFETAKAKIKNYLTEVFDNEAYKPIFEKFSKETGFSFDLDNLFAEGKTKQGLVKSLKDLYNEVLDSTKLTPDEKEKVKNVFLPRIEAIDVKKIDDDFDSIVKFINNKLNDIEGEKWRKRLFGDSSDLTEFKNKLDQRTSEIIGSGADAIKALKQNVDDYDAYLTEVLRNIPKTAEQYIDTNVFDILGVSNIESATFQELIEIIKTLDDLDISKTNIEIEGLEPDIINAFLEKLKELKAELTKSARFELSQESLNELSHLAKEISNIQDDLISSLSTITSELASSIRTLRSESGGFEKASALIGVFLKVVNEIQTVGEDRAKERTQQEKSLNQLGIQRLGIENDINQSISDRIQLEREYSAFITTTAVQDINNYYKIIEDARSNYQKTTKAVFEDGLLGSNGSITINQFKELLAIRSTNLGGGVIGGGEGLSALDIFNVIGDVGTSSEQGAAKDDIINTFNKFLTSVEAIGYDRSFSLDDFNNLSNEELDILRRSLSEAGVFTDEFTNALVADINVYEASIAESMDGIKTIVSEVAGSLSNDFRNTIVESFIAGTDAAGAFTSSLESVIEELVSITLFDAIFRSSFDKFQKDLAGEFDSEGNLIKGTEGAISKIQTDSTGKIIESSIEPFLEATETLFTNVNNLTPVMNEALSGIQGLGEGYGFDLFSGDPNGGVGNGQLAQAISGITEDQANILAGLGNSIRESSWITSQNTISLVSSANNMLSLMGQEIANTNAIRQDLGIMKVAVESTNNILKLATLAGSGTKVNIN